MSTAMTFKCPCCGGYLEFDPSLQKFKCLYCGQVLSEDDLRDQSEQRQADAEAAQAEQAPVQTGSLRSYHCTQCGAEVVTDATTAATRCYYCHSPIVLHDRLDDDFRPDGVIPFKIGREQALAAFKAYLKKKKFVDHAFFDGAQMEMFSGVYYPWWYCDVEGEGSFEGQGTRVSVTTSSKYITTTTSYYRVEREGRFSFRNIARKALTKADAALSDGIHPYDVRDVEPYASGYLSGFLAEKRDIELDDVKGDMLREAEGYAEDMMRRPTDFNTLTGETSLRRTNVTSRYVLLPAWVLTFKGGRDGVPYYYMMNGQTGRVCGKLPINRGKLYAWALGAGAIVFALLRAGGALLW